MFDLVSEMYRVDKFNLFRSSITSVKVDFVCGGGVGHSLQDVGLFCQTCWNSRKKGDKTILFSIFIWQRLHKWR